MDVEGRDLAGPIRSSRSRKAPAVSAARLNAVVRHFTAMIVDTEAQQRTIVWMVDIAGLSRAEAVDLMRWSAQALLHQATTVAPPAAPDHR